MKILHVSIKYDYGIPERGYSPYWHDFYTTLTKMNDGKFEVVYFPHDEILLQSGREGMNKKLLETVYKEKPGLVFFVVGDDSIRKEVIREITEKSGALTLNWHSDDHWKFYNYSRYWAPYYHWVAITDPDTVPKYQNIGYKNVILSQWGFDHFSYEARTLPKKYDVTFVGAAHGNRKAIIKKLLQAGVEVECWGKGWPNGKASHDEMLTIWSQSKINLNFTKSSGVLWKEIASIFLRRGYDRVMLVNNPTRWLDNIKTSYASLYTKQIKGRNFEIPGCNTFFLTEYVRHLEDYYEIEKEVVTFQKIPELTRKIRYYLEHEGERELIAQAGYERTLKDHTWEKRFNDIFKTIGFLNDEKKS